VSFRKVNTNHGDPRGAVSINLRAFQELERSVSFMYKVIDGLIVVTSPVYLKKEL